MLKAIAVALGLVAATPVVAPAQAPPAQEQALSAKLLEEINDNIVVRRQLAEAQARVRELEASCPKKDK